LNRRIRLLKSRNELQQQQRKEIMLANAKKMVTSLTEVAIALLALAIVASVLVGPDNMAFLGDVVGNITALVQQLGSAGLAGLIALGVVLALFQK
jgi:hypothetical protein